MDNLDHWFGKEEANQAYAEGVKDNYFLAAQFEELPIGFIAIKEHNQFTSEIYVLGILKDFHRQGIGEQLLKIADEKLVQDEKKFLTVKTLSESHPDKYYQKTRKFYRAMGFYPLEEMPELWSEEQPCLYMVKVLPGSK